MSNTARETPVNVEAISTYGRGCRHYKDKKSFLEQHYPYCNNYIYKGGMSGTVHLLNDVDDERLARLPYLNNRELLIFKILEEVGRAMHYCIVFQPVKGFEEQAKEAFAMFQLLTYGKDIWQPNAEIPLPYEQTAKEDVARHRLPEEGDAPGAEHWGRGSVEDEEKGLVERWSRGEERHVSLYPTIREFSLLELRAIWAIVADSFENMC